MNGQKLLNNTLKINALFSLFSGLDFIVLDSAIVRILTGGNEQSVLPTGVMLIGFSVFVFGASMMKHVNKYLVGTIIAMDLLWVIGSAVLVIAEASILTVLGQALVIAIALVIGLFAYFQAKGLRRHLALG